MVLRRRYWIAAVVLTAAILTKETALLFVLAAAVTSRRQAIPFTLPVATEVPQLLVCVKSPGFCPVIPTPAMDNGEVPVFVSVTF